MILFILTNSYNIFNWFPSFCKFTFEINLSFMMVPSSSISKKSEDGKICNMELNLEGYFCQLRHLF
eukprot:Pgem_evm1s306